MAVDWPNKFLLADAADVVVAPNREALVDEDAGSSSLRSPNSVVGILGLTVPVAVVVTVLVELDPEAASALAPNLAAPKTPAVELAPNAGAENPDAAPPAIHPRGRISL